MVVLAFMVPLMVLAVAIATVPIVVSMLREDRGRRAALSASPASVRIERRRLPEAA